MTQDISVFDNYRADVLFLLVGGNPLPNYVSAQLMAREKADIHLLVTPDTQEVAKRLEKKLQQVMPRATFCRDPVPETGGYEIDCAIVKILQEANIGDRRVGLNYTGGTKDMAVHVYDKIQDTHPQGVFSYLDARRLSMGICVGANPTQWPSVALAIAPTLQDLWELHGLIPDATKPSSRQEPRLKNLVHGIAKVHSTAAGFREWRRWLAMLKTGEIVPTEDEFEELEPFITQLAADCGTDHPDAAQVAALFEQPTLRKCDDFLRGKWLEEWTMWSLLSIREAYDLKHWALGLYLEQDPKFVLHPPAPPSFELDVVALRGYQLFLLSCIATEGMEKVSERDDPRAGDRGEAKRHLFEAYSRARQVGGDEARVGLVSCVAYPDKLRAEVTHEWDAKGKIWVFGQSDLLDLPNKLAKWFRTANQE